MDFRKLFAVRSWHVTYQRMSRMPDEDDRGGVIVKKFKDGMIWIGFSTRTDLWLISFWKKEKSELAACTRRVDPGIAGDTRRVVKPSLISVDLESEEYVMIGEK